MVNIKKYSNKSVDTNDLLDEKLDGGGKHIFLDNNKLDNEYAQMVQDLLEMRS